MSQVLAQSLVIQSPKFALVTHLDEDDDEESEGNSKEDEGDTDEDEDKEMGNVY